MCIKGRNWIQSNNSENTYARKSYFQCILLRTAGGNRICRTLQMFVSKLQIFFCNKFKASSVAKFFILEAHANNALIHKWGDRCLFPTYMYLHSNCTQILAYKKRQKHEKKSPPLFYLFSMQLFSADAMIFSNFFLPLKT